MNALAKKQIEFKDPQINTISKSLDKMKAQMTLALPKHISVERMIRLALTTLQSNNTLKKCSTTSVLSAVMQASQCGLELDGFMGHAYLVPFWNKHTKSYEAQFMPGYKGLISLARRSGEVNFISAHVVYDLEPFTLKFGVEESLDHKPLPPSQRGENKIGAYAVVKLKDGSTSFRFLWAEDIEEIKKTALAGKKNTKSSPWTTHENAMWEKTAIRNLAKFLPLSAEFSKAAALDEMADAGLSTVEVFEGIPVEEPETKPKDIDQAFNDLANGNIEDTSPIQPETTQETTEKEQNPPKTDQKESKTNQNPQENDKEAQFIAILEEIDSFNINAGPMTAYTVRAIGANKPREEWTFEDAGKVLDYVKQMKGAK